MDRPTIPADVVRAVLVEAGHRCAIPTCRATTTEVAHIEPWAKTQDNSFSNLIALCPNCHTRYDQRKEIDAKSMRMYKRNLGLLNSRYGEFERRVFAHVARTAQHVFLIGAGAELLLANAVQDGLLTVEPVDTIGINVKFGSGEVVKFPMSFLCSVTPKGAAFMHLYKEGGELE